MKPQALEPWAEGGDRRGCDMPSQDNTLVGKWVLKAPPLHKDVVGHTWARDMAPHQLGPIASERVLRVLPREVMTTDGHERAPEELLPEATAEGERARDAAR
jgi:hypothetical protein